MTSAHGSRATDALPYADEMLHADGSVRKTWLPLDSALATLGPQEVRSRAETLARTYLAQGVTFDFAGNEQPFPLDPVPRIIDGAEWARISVGIAQRVRALEAFLEDVHTAGRVLLDGVIPAGVLRTDLPEVHAVRGYTPPNGVRIHVSGIDLIRDGYGTIRVLEDNVRTPSGVSYVLSNRRAMAHTYPELFPASGVRRVAEYPSRLLRTLVAAAPQGAGDDATVVVLTPGRHNSAYFEHSLLARTMGVELVEAGDLVVRKRRVYMRTTAGPRRVDVIYKRTDDAFLDPTVLRSDSLLGVPGLLRAVHAGNVVLANAIGNAVADDKLTYTYVPDLIRYYLGEEPVLPNVRTWRLEDPQELGEVLDRLEELVIKPVDGSGGKDIVIGADASREELEAIRAKIIASPRDWVAQPLTHLATIPTLDEDSGLRPRHADLRPFALNSGDGIWVLPGGLTRVALAEGERIVNSSRGGGSKDTWVLRTDAPAPVPVPTSTGEVRIIEEDLSEAEEDSDDLSPAGRHEQSADAPETARRRSAAATEPPTVTATVPILSTAALGEAQDAQSDR